MNGADYHDSSLIDAKASIEYTRTLAVGLNGDDNYDRGVFDVQTNS